MKVYAEFFNENGLDYRKNTLLQFGDSWDLIGNIVLANPGSARPIGDISEYDAKNIDVFYKKYRKEELIKSDTWKVFSPDQTMGFIKKIFNGEYVGEKLELNGIIQLFNTFNIKNQHLEEAVKLIGTDSELLFSYGIESYFNDKPTYFGFSNEILKNPVLRQVAEEIFKNSSKKIKSIYRQNFAENSFYHPMYINRAYKKENFQQYKNQILVPLIR